MINDHYKGATTVGTYLKMCRETRLNLLCDHRLIFVIENVLSIAEKNNHVKKVSAYLTSSKADTMSII
jgi:hypothetical protein